MGGTVTLRLVLVAVATVVLGLVDGYLVATERIAPGEPEARHTTLPDDPLLAMRYTPSERRTNLRAFGMDDATAARTTARIETLDGKYRSRLDAMLETAPNPTELADALCGQTREARPPYAALRFLVEDSDGTRQAIRLERATSLGPRAWSTTSPVVVFEHAELGLERQPDATTMAIAAILLGREADLLANRAPWGRGATGTWSFNRVLKEHPAIEERIVDYFALLHLTVERASAEGGICGD